MDHIDIGHVVLLIVAVVCWLEKRRERRQAHEDAAAQRARYDLARLGRDSWRGRAS